MLPLQLLLDRQTLDFDQSVRAFEEIMTGQATPVQIAAFLSLLAVREPTVEEIAGAATVMRSKATRVRVPEGLIAIDTCGTGGDHAGTFNISTAAALVAAAVGRPRNVVVAKHGNRSVTSRSGSSQVLEALGVKLAVGPDTLTRCLDEAGLCFCFAPAHHPAMKHAGPVRAELGFRTLFNILGPLTNPADARRQVVGVFRPELVALLPRVLQRLGAHAAMVVHGTLPGGGIDEVSTMGPTRLGRLDGDHVTLADFDAATLGIARPTTDDLRVDSPSASADLLRAVFDPSARDPRASAARDIVALNAAAALLVADLADDWLDALGQARHALEQRTPQRTLDALIRITQSDRT